MMRDLLKPSGSWRIVFGWERPATALWVQFLDWNVQNFDWTKLIVTDLYHTAIASELMGINFQYTLSIMERAVLDSKCAVEQTTVTCAAPNYQQSDM